jgi:hypothetical protein
VLSVEAARAAGRALTRPRHGGPELTAIVLSDLPIVSPWCRDDASVMETEYGPLKLPLGALTAFRVGLVNTGNEALLAEKFQRPIRIDYAADAHVVNLTMKWRRHGQLHPEDDAIEIEGDDHAILIRPPLVNPGDALVLDGIAASTVPLDLQLSVRYPNLPAVEAMRFRSSDVSVEFENFDLEAKKIRWVWLRKLLPKKLRYQRAAQLRDAIDVLLHWDESR